MQALCVYYLWPSNDLGIAAWAGKCNINDRDGSLQVTLYGTSPFDIL